MRRKSELVPGIDLPGLPIRSLRDWTLAAAVQPGGDPDARVLVYGCASGVNLAALRNSSVAVVELQCIAQLPPAFIDFVISRRHADGVFLLGCRQNDCHFRLGVQWMDERLAGKRDPYLRARVPRERIATYWGGQVTQAEIADEINAFRARLRALGPYRPVPATPATDEEAP